MPSSRINPWKALPIQDPGPLRCKTPLSSPPHTKRRDDETSNFSTRRADDWCHQQPRPPRFKTFSWPEDNSGSELCRIRFLSCCCCLDLPHHHPSNQPPLHHHKPWTMISGEIFGKMFINVWLQSCWKYRQCEYAKRQFFSWGLKA